MCFPFGLVNEKESFSSLDDYRIRKSAVDGCSYESIAFIFGYFCFLER